MKRVYWDSCCFIDYLEGTEKGSSLKGVVELFEKGELEIVTSAITITEVLKLKAGTPSDRELITSFFSNSKGLLVVELSKHLAEQSRELIWKFNYSKHKQDAIHLATAVYVNRFKPISEIHSFDSDLLKLNGAAEIPIPIVKPSLANYPQSTESMFDANGNIRPSLQ